MIFKDRIKFTKEIVYVSLFIVGIILISVLLLNRIEKIARKDIGESLKTVLNTTHDSFMFWIRHRKFDIMDTIANNHFKPLAEKLIKMHERKIDIKSSRELQELRNFMKPRLKKFRDLGFFIISRDKINVASMRNSNIGKINLIKMKYDNILNRVLKGETLLIPPIRSDVPLPESRQNYKVDYPTMFIAAPVKFKNNRIIGILTKRIDPGKIFTEISKSGRIGKTGETFAFDETGFFISESRFIKQLYRAGILRKGESILISLKITDPGGNIIKGYKPAKSRLEQPLTIMARNAVLGNSGVNISGYRDYRGIRVLGAWLWDKKMGFGIATEIDEQEVLASFYLTRKMVILGLTGTSLLALFLVLSLVATKKSSARTILENEKRLEHAMQATSDGLWDVDLVNDRSYINTRYFQMLGYSENEIPPPFKDPFFDLLHPDDLDRIKSFINNLPNHSENRFELEYRLKTRDSRYKWILSKGKIVEKDVEGNPTRVVGVNVDISKKKEVEYNIIKARDAAESANRAKSQLVANISHEFKTPMNAIIGITDLLIKTELSKKQAELLDMISKSAHAMDETTNDIIELSLIEAGMVKLVDSKFPLKTIFDNITSYIKSRLNGKSIKIDYHIDELIPALIIGDAGKLRKVLFNLADNAVKFTESGEIKLFAVIEPVNDEGQFIKFTVKDTGEGIGPDAIMHIFNSFTQVDGSPTRKHGGLGLGLSLCKNLVELMGGDIKVKSSVNEGSEFSFTMRFKSNIGSDKKAAEIPD